MLKDKKHIIIYINLCLKKDKVIIDSQHFISCQISVQCVQHIRKDLLTSEIPLTHVQ